MNKIDIENLSDVLGIDLSVKQETEIVTIDKSDYQIEESNTESNITVESIDTTELDNDFQLAKKNIINILDHGESVLESAENVAVQTENPKTIEAFASLVNSLTNASEKLLELHSKRKSIIEKNKKEEGSNGSVTNNTVAFVGSPSDLRKILRKENETNPI